MIRVRITPEGLEARGHAGAGPKGCDIVCAAVSALVYTLVGCLEEAGTLEDCRLSPGYARVQGRGPALEVVATGLRLLGERYPQAVEVRF